MEKTQKMIKIKKKNGMVEAYEPTDQQKICEHRRQKRIYVKVITKILSRCHFIVNVIRFISFG